LGQVLFPTKACENSDTYVVFFVVANLLIVNYIMIVKKLL